MHKMSQMLPALIVVCLLFVHQELPACTSFMLESDDGLFYAHSLNQGSVERVPGIVVINQRLQWKSGYSWEALVDVDNLSAPNLVWKSAYGSITFNPFGIELPDGGMNEEGLFIWEMGFDTEYPRDQDKPVLFQGQWMQYVLDNCRSVQEAIECADLICLDGWGWHYFVADKSGATAIIDFVDGRRIVYTGDQIPIPLCCNSVYPEALRWLRQYDGFGGELEIKKIEAEIPRFIYGAKLLKEFGSQDPVEYCFHTLNEMSSNVRWAIVFDVTRSQVYFNTNIDANIRYFSFASEDFSAENGPAAVNIDCPGPGDIRDKFVKCDADLNEKTLIDVFELLCGTDKSIQKALLEDQGIDVEQFAKAVNIKITSPDTSQYHEFSGEWVGYMYISHDADSDSLEIEFEFTGNNPISEGELRGLNDSESILLTNIARSGGLLQFTVMDPQQDGIWFFELYSTADEIRGAATNIISGKKGRVRLTRANTHQE